jgi:hypothetical protein
VELRGPELVKWRGTWKWTRTSSAPAVGRASRAWGDRASLGFRRRGAGFDLVEIDWLVEGAEGGEGRRGGVGAEGGGDLDFWDADAFGFVEAERFGGVFELEGGVAGIETDAEGDGG